MNQAPTKPHYSAVILSSSGVDLGPIHLADANNDDEARAFAHDRAAKWMAANGVDRATVQIVKDGVSFPPIRVETL